LNHEKHQIFCYRSAADYRFFRQPLPLTNPLTSLQPVLRKSVWCP
jgi:hypothetical protein